MRLMFIKVKRMAKNNFTHTATIVGVAYNRGRKYKVNIRYLNSYIVDECKTKYKRETGNIIGERFAIWRLDLESIKEIEVNNGN